MTIKCILWKSLLWTTGNGFCQNLSKLLRILEKVSLSCHPKGIDVKNVSMCSHCHWFRYSPNTTVELAHRTSELSGISEAFSESQKWESFL
jgi:hypothetical protein